MQHLISKNQVQHALEDAYLYAKQVTGGVNAHYIPYLANVNPNLLAVSVMLPDGTSFHCGDTSYQFGIESISKVPTALLGMEQYSAIQMKQMIGAEATGLPFNSIIAILLENDQPSTPLVNAGAIAACSMVRPIGDSDAKWKAIVGFITDLCASEPTLIDELYKSESETNFNNRAIMWLLREYGKIYDDPSISLDLYTRQCSLGITTQQLVTMAATIANKGLNPVTKKQVFDPKLAAKIVSLIATVGFYQKTGDWMFTTGIPAKSGVGGGVLGILPGVLGIAAFAPPLDEAGNSVRAQAAVRFFVQQLGLGIFDGNHISIEE